MSKVFLKNALFGISFIYGRFLFRSGNPDHPEDLFKDTTVEVIPEVWPTAELVGMPMAEQGQQISDGFILVGHFDEDGLVEGIVPETIGRVRVLRLHVHSRSSNWVVLSEVSSFCTLVSTITSCIYFNLFSEASHTLSFC